MANVVDDALRTQVRNIEAQYGRSMGAWTDLIRSRGLTKHTQIIAFFQKEFVKPGTPRSSRGSSPSTA